MLKKMFIFPALLGLLLTGCANDDPVGPPSPTMISLSVTGSGIERLVATNTCDFKVAVFNSFSDALNWTNPIAGPYAGTFTNLATQSGYDFYDFMSIPDTEVKTVYVLGWIDFNLDSSFSTGDYYQICTNVYSKTFPMSAADLYLEQIK